MELLAEAGITLVGENTAQSLAAKHERYGDRFTFDFIGHLQSRKTKDVLPLARLIHSVESESVLLEDRAARAAHGRGAARGQRLRRAEQTRRRRRRRRCLPRAGGRYERTSFSGLMTMPPATDDPDDARPWFAALRELAQRLRTEWAPRHRFEILSMGTSQDYAVAVEEGATIVRLGSVLYRSPGKGPAAPLPRLTHW